MDEFANCTAICLQGMTLTGALRNMSRKHKVPELTNVSEAIIAADRADADMIVVLRGEANRIRDEYGV